MSYGTNSPAPSQTKVPGCPISAKNCSFFSMASTLDLKKKFLIPSKTIHEPYCVPVAIDHFRLDGSQKVGLDNF